VLAQLHTYRDRSDRAGYHGSGRDD